MNQLTTFQLVAIILGSFFAGMYLGFMILKLFLHPKPEPKPESPTPTPSRPVRVLLTTGRRLLSASRVNYPGGVLMLHDEDDKLVALYAAGKWIGLEACEPEPQATPASAPVPNESA